jgi:hypothetical protein
LNTSDTGPRPPARVQLGLPDWHPGADLMPLEEEMRAKAAAGELMDRGAGPFDLAQMQGWGEERAVRAVVLRHVLVEADWPVGVKGVRLRGVRISGHLDLEAATLRCPLWLDSCYLDADAPACFNHVSASRVTLTGCQLDGLKGDRLTAIGLDMSRSVFSSMVQLACADIADEFDCRGAMLNGRDDDGHALAAYGIKVGGDARLDGMVTTAGAVLLVGADITGQLILSDARLNGRAGNGYALAADRMKVGGNMWLDRAVISGGALRLAGADLRLQLSCHGTQLTGTDSVGLALNASGMKVGSDVYLDQQFTTTGAVRLVGTDITGQLILSDARLNGRAENGYALAADRMKVGGNMWLDRAVISGGALRLAGADLRLQLSCHGTQLTGTDSVGLTLNASGMKVGADVYVDQRFTADGTVSLALAQIAGTLVWAPAGPISGQVNLEDASVGQLNDSGSDVGSDGYGPTGGRLLLDGFTYGRFSGKPQAKVNQRLAWVRSQYHGDDPAPFATQPYEQLAAVYRQAGQDSQARKVAIARRADLRKYGNLNWYRWFGNWLMDWTIKYGYQAWRAGAGLVAVFLVFAALSCWAQNHRLMAPVGATSVGLYPVPAATICTSSYPCFSPIGYAIDTVIPIINVHQADQWGPDEAAQWGRPWVAATWIATALGWALATLLVAGYTGLVRQD